MVSKLEGMFNADSIAIIGASVGKEGEKHGTF